MPEFLLELGTEELPASFVRATYSELQSSLNELLHKAGVLDGPSRVFGTPRRQIVSFSNLLSRQADSVKEQRGPALKAAYDADGNPTPALQGFCRSQGITPEELRKDDQYVWVTKTVVGKDTRDLLSELVPQAIRSLNFPKSMRWGASRMRFARPIRWILAAYDGKVVPFDVEGVQAGLESCGHRFYSPEIFQATTFDGLVDELRKRFVEPDPEVRKALIIGGAEKVAAGTPLLTDDLVDENVFLTEWPTPLQGQFRSEYMSLPEPVLITAMAKHEKMFPVRDAGGALTSNFVFVRNSGEDETVRRGNEWVLNARFNDAKFFFDEDAKSNLDYFLEKTSGIVFQEKLGNIRSRADRLAELSLVIAKATGADGLEAEHARKAGLYCKADLSTGLVSELASLQGIIGGEYAKREGFAEPVAWAIATQYDPAKNATPGTPAARTAVRIVMADALDKLAGYLGLGLEPSGSSDPFGLRRAATTLIEAAWNWPSPLPTYYELFAAALLQYDKQAVRLDTTVAFPALADVFASRYASMMPDVRHDILEAAMLRQLHPQVTNPRRVRFRVKVLQMLAVDTSFVQAATRPMNIVVAAAKKSIEFESADPLMKLPQSPLESAEGLELLQLLSDIAQPLRDAELNEDVAETARLLKSMETPINRFFETTMVMDDQPDVRFARLTLMQACSLALLTAGDFTKLVIEGGA